MRKIKVTFMVLVVLFTLLSCDATPQAGSTQPSLIIMKRGTIEFIYAKDWLALKPDEYDTGVVFEHVDGDTIKIKISSKSETVRLIGVDTPETVHPSQPVERFGKAASLFTKKLVTSDEPIRVSYDWNPRDKYGRLLAYVWFEATWQNEKYWVLHNLVLIINGFGNAYTAFPFKQEYMNIFREAERFARENKIGLWSEVNEDQIIAMLEDGSYSPRIYNSAFLQTPPATSTSILDTTVYITKTGSKYHKAGCRYLDQSAIPIKLRDAVARGYTPCSVCKPPVP